MYLPIAAMLTGIWLILFSQEVPSTTLTLIFGIVIAILGFLASSWGEGIRR